MATTANERALLKSLLKTATFAIDRNCEITGTAYLDRENENIIVLQFFVSDDPQPDNDVFGEPEPIVIKLIMDRIEAFPFGPEVLFANINTNRAKSTRHTYSCIAARFGGAPEICITR